MVGFRTLLVTTFQDPSKTPTGCSGIPRPHRDHPKTPTGLPQDLPDLPDSSRTSRICLGHPPPRFLEDPSGPLQDPLCEGHPTAPPPSVTPLPPPARGALESWGAFFWRGLPVHRGRTDVSCSRTACNSTMTLQPPRNARCFAECRACGPDASNGRPVRDDSSYLADDRHAFAQANLPRISFAL